MPSDLDLTEDILKRGVVEVIDEQHLRDALRRRRPLRVKLGIDATSSKLHLGHAVALRKLRAFQRAGHQAVLVIGEATARIGDPSGKDETRSGLTQKEVERNAQTYLEQAGKILDIRKTEVRRNSEWLDRLTLTEVLRLSATSTVQQMLAHETFASRIKDGHALGVHEILYPLLQGFDSVAIKADVELGGIDQKFNVLAGRFVQRAYKMPAQDVMLMDYLVGTDGRKKMSKSLGNTIDLTDAAAEMFGKVMSLPDTQIVPYFTLVTDTPLESIAEIRKGLRQKKLHPRDAKIQLGRAVLETLFDPAEVDLASERFVRVHRRKELPSDMPTLLLRTGQHKLIELLVSQKIAGSRSEARRLVEQGGVKIDGRVVREWAEPIALSHGSVLAVGKRRFYRIQISG